jgi:hypothetical protein
MPGLDYFIRQSALTQEKARSVGNGPGSMQAAGRGKPARESGNACKSCCRQSADLTGERFGGACLCDDAQPFRRIDAEGRGMGKMEIGAAQADIGEFGVRHLAEVVNRAAVAPGAKRFPYEIDDARRNRRARGRHREMAVFDRRYRLSPCHIDAVFQSRRSSIQSRPREEPASVGDIGNIAKSD